jgi:S-adenosylhomocysteine hydrolase
MHNLILCSVGSKKNEIDVEGLNNISLSIKSLAHHVTEYKLPENKTVILLK